MSKRGYVTGEPKSTKIDAITSEAFSVGEYVNVKTAAHTILGMVEESAAHSMMLSDVTSFDDARELSELVGSNVRDKKYTAGISLVGSLESMRGAAPAVPVIPPTPGDEVTIAGTDDLTPVFAPDTPEWARVGTLLHNSEISVKVNLDKVAARHAAILAMTGMGKSNMVSLLTREIVERNGTVIIFDYHDDYGTLGMKNLNVLDAKINPRKLGADELAEMLDFRANAEKQRSLLDRSFTKDVRASSDFWEALVESVRNTAQDDKTGGVAHRVIEKIEYAKKRMDNVLDAEVGDPMSLIKVGYANVLSVSEFSEKQANAALSFYMRKILEDRKDATVSRRRGSATASKFLAPVLVVIEEAHVFIPRDTDTGAKYWASRIAREGRKFGVGLCIVSQRPRGIDPSILSQMGSFAVMRIIQPEDQKYVASASEHMRRALVTQLGTLNVGEAVMTGQWTKLDAIVRIDEVKEKTAGADPSAVREWAQEAKKRNVGVEVTSDMVQKDLLL